MISSTENHLRHNAAIVHSYDGREMENKLLLVLFFVFFNQHMSGLCIWSSSWLRALATMSPPTFVGWKKKDLVFY